MVTVPFPTIATIALISILIEAGAASGFNSSSFQPQIELISPSSSSLSHDVGNSRYYFYRPVAVPNERDSQQSGVNDQDLDRALLLAASEFSHRDYKVSSPTWENCGRASDPFRLETLDFQPPVLHFPESIKVNYAATLATDVQGPVKVTLEVKRKIGPMWMKIPCKLNIGSCEYQDLCALLPKLHIHLPPTLKCPFKKGRYSESDLDLDLPKIPLPNWMVNGKYSIKAQVSNSHAALGCVKLTLKLK